MKILYRTICLSILLILGLTGCDKKEEVTLSNETVVTPEPELQTDEASTETEVVDTDSMPPSPQQQSTITAEDMAAEAAMGAHD